MPWVAFPPPPLALCMQAVEDDAADKPAPVSSGWAPEPNCKGKGGKAQDKGHSKGKGKGGKAQDKGSSWSYHKCVAAVCARGGFCAWFPACRRKHQGNDWYDQPYWKRGSGERRRRPGSGAGCWAPSRLCRL